MKEVLCFLVLCLLLRIQADRIKRQAKYPRMERTCYRDMPAAELNECLKTNFQKSIPKFKSGIPGIYSGTLEPFFWPKFAHYFGRGLVQGSLLVKDIDVWGISNVKVQAIRADVRDPRKMNIEMDWKAPKLDFFGQFKVKGKMGPAAFNGAGPFTLNLTGVSGTWRVIGSRERSKPFMEITSFKGSPKIETLKLWAKGVALGNPQLNDAVLATINRAWRLFQEIANPAVDREWGSFCKQRLNQVFLNVPYDELFPLRKPTG